MEIILLQDVKSLGKADEIVKVKDGYGRNLVAKQAAVEATPKALNDLKIKKKNEAKLAAEQLAEAQALAEKINKCEVTIGIKTGENGKVFGSISAKEVAEALKSQKNIDIDKKKLVMQPFKNMGSFTATVKLHPQVSAELGVKVVEEK
ncbi:MAG: 50S ribosomal protein L9 [Lachnospiraceae bacterium]|nr:50S ribosomal protein L9 [Lachnospiraceae bacterium]MBR6275291.1 50S ribosomal protein L9 [Lachnospiraceae bacterium]